MSNERNNAILGVSTGTRCADIRDHSIHARESERTKVDCNLEMQRLQSQLSTNSIKLRVPEGLAMTLIKQAS